MRKTFLSFSKPRIEADEIREVVDSLKSGWLTMGPKVVRFQEEFQKYMQVPHAVAVNSCTSGLFLSLVAAEVGPGDEVITVPFTFAATAAVIIHRGAKPVFVDVDPETMNMDPSKIEKKITRRTKAIIPVHFAGRPCEMDAILKIARKHKLIVIQDAAHSLEAIYHGKKIGAIGDFTAFSFYATKNLTTGDGGMITTTNRKWAERLQVLCMQGMTRGAWTRYSASGFKQYEVLEAGFKMNMVDLQAGMGLRQLAKIERFYKVRERLWGIYDRGLQGLPLEIPVPAETGTRHAKHLYTVLLDLKALKIDRNQFQHELFKRKIGTSVHFLSLHMQPYYRKALGLKPSDYPVSAALSARTMSLPLSASMTDRDAQDVVEAVTEIAEKYQK